MGNLGLNGESPVKSTRPSCRKFRNDAVQPQRHALAHNLGNFMRQPELPKEQAK